MRNKTISQARKLLLPQRFRQFSSTASRFCGLVSVLSKKLPTSFLDKPLKTLRHRGPDYAGSWTNNARTVSLGHTRLSIIDLSATGNQPLSNVDNSVHAVVNGELYDFERIKDDLKKRGYIFKTHSDSELVLALYEEYGMGMFSHLRGEFAFTLYDEKNKIFLAAKDRFGIKPLYFTQTEDSIMFASECKAFFQMGVKCAWDIDSVQHDLYAFGNATVFKNVYQVPPGHYVLIREEDPKNAQMVRYWDFDYPAQDAVDTRSEQEMIQGVRQRLEDAVALRLRADVPVATYLSGGIDSCAVLGLASKVLKTRVDPSKSIDAFTIGFDHKVYDETEIAERQAKLSGSKFHRILATQDLFADNFEEAIYYGETITYQPNFMGKFLLSKFVRDSGYKVVMTGEGSDETFCGYPWFKMDIIAKLPEKEREQLIAHLIRTNPAAGHILTLSKHEGIAELKKWSGVVSAFQMLQFELLSKLQTYYLNPASILQQMKSQVLSQISAPVVEKMKHKWDPVHSSMYIWSKMSFQNFILTMLADRMEMSHSIEGRVPFLDHHLVEYVNNLPLNMKVKCDLKNGVMNEKYVLKEATKDVITEEVYKRTKHPYSAPPSVLDKQGKFYQYLQENVRSNEFAKVPFVDHEKTVKFMDAVHKEEDPITIQRMDAVLLRLGSIYALQKKFNPQ